MIPEAATLTPEEIARRSRSNFLASFVKTGFARLTSIETASFQRTKSAATC